MKAYGGSGCIDPHFLYLGTSWRLVASFVSDPFAPCTHWRGGWVDHRIGLADVGKRKFLKLPAFELRPLGRPARS
jgi:hypothetical protein